MSETRRIIAALTGSIGSGKSSAARRFEELGATVVDADVLARLAVAPGTSALESIRRTFGDEVLTAAGELDRKRLGTVVFGDRNKLKTLESIVHPEVRRLFDQELRSFLGNSASPVFIYVVPLLFEAGRHPAIERVITVTSPRDEAIRRIMERDGCDRALAEKKFDSQLPPEEKERRSDFVIRNDSTLEHLRNEVDRVYDSLRGGI